MKERELAYQSGGVTMTGYLVDGSRGAPAPGVLIAHEAIGRDERMTVWARKLAEQGYVALALDLYGQPISLAEMTARHEQMMTTDRGQTAHDGW